MRRQGQKTGVVHWIEVGDCYPAANCLVSSDDASSPAMGAVTCPDCLRAIQLRLDTLAMVSRGIATLPTPYAL